VPGLSCRAHSSSALVANALGSLSSNSTRISLGSRCRKLLPAAQSRHLEQFLRLLEVRQLMRGDEAVLDVIIGRGGCSTRSATILKDSCGSAATT
jgi:hypothetical protein